MESAKMMLVLGAMLGLAQAMVVPPPPPPPPCVPWRITSGTGDDKVVEASGTFCNTHINPESPDCIAEHILSGVPGECDEDICLALAASHVPVPQCKFMIYETMETEVDPAKLFEQDYYFCPNPLVVAALDAALANAQTTVPFADCKGFTIDPAPITPTSDACSDENEIEVWMYEIAGNSPAPKGQVGSVCASSAYNCFNDYLSGIDFTDIGMPECAMENNGGIELQPEYPCLWGTQCMAVVFRHDGLVISETFTYHCFDMAMPAGVEQICGHV